MSALRCTHCGYLEAIASSAEQVVEHPFEDYKDGPKGWGAELKRYDCKQCGARTSIEPHITSFECAFCSSNQVVPQSDTIALHKPESILPFAVNQKQCLEEFRRWVNGLWFRPNALKKQATPDKLRGVYMPFWTYDSLTDSYWSAQAGHYYYVKDSQGNRRRKVRWEPASGRYNQYFDDLLVPGSPSVGHDLIQDLQPFSTQALIDYKSEYLAGFAAEDYRQDMLECWPVAKSSMETTIYNECARQIPGDTYRQLSISTSYLNRTYKLCLLPIWIASYRYGGEPYRYVVNGQTGAVAGRAPWSWVKITLFVLTLAALIGAFVWWRGNAG
ncbi:MAG TPA: hypothetical protein EYN06_09965 [Myxococcales bacterium]|nr:hypothetical protein [Myxococcales bacterium]HIN86795.1 hypothetical protein [Myxococcales bacterium]